MRNRNGFTLVELLVTLAVASIILAIGVPSFATLIQNNSMTAKTNELVGIITTARSEAAKAGQTVGLCGSSDGSTCNTTDWENGWLVYVDANNDGARQSAERIVRVQSGSEGFTVRVSGGAAGSTPLRYEPSGFFSTASAATVTICDDRGAAEARAINLNVTGRPSLATDNNGDGTVEDASGNAVTCP